MKGNQRDCTNSQINKFLANKRIAFLMAWHPRLGMYALISKLIVKDVGRMIASQYITLNSQIVNKAYNNDIIILHSGQRVALTVHKPNKNLHLVSFIDRSLCKYKNVYIQMPEMDMPFDLYKNDDNQTYLVCLHPASFPDDKARKFINWIDSIDNMIKNELRKSECALKKMSKYQFETTDAYQASFRHRSIYQRDDVDIIDYPPLINIKIKTQFDKTICLKNNEMISFQQAIQRKILGRGARVKPLVKHVGVWNINGKYFNQYQLEKLLVINESAEYKISHFPILPVMDDKSETS